MSPNIQAVKNPKCRQIYRLLPAVAGCMRCLRRLYSRGYGQVVNIMKHNDSARAGTAGRQIAVILSPNTTRRVPSVLRTQYIQTHERVVAVTRTPLYFSRFPNVTCLSEDCMESNNEDKQIQSVISNADLLILDDIMYDVTAASFDRARSLNPSNTIVIVMQASCHVQRIVQTASMLHVPSNNPACCKLLGASVYGADALDLKHHEALI